MIKVYFMDLSQEEPMDLDIEIPEDAIMPVCNMGCPCQLYYDGLCDGVLLDDLY